MRLLGSLSGHSTWYPVACHPSRGLCRGQIILLRFENVAIMFLIWVSDEKVVFKNHLFDL